MPGWEPRGQWDRGPGVAWANELGRLILFPAFSFCCLPPPPAPQPQPPHPQEPGSGTLGEALLEGSPDNQRGWPS